MNGKNETVWEVAEGELKSVINGEGPGGSSKEWDPEHSGGISFDVEGLNSHPDRVPERKMGKMSCGMKQVLSSQI